MLMPVVGAILPCAIAAEMLERGAGAGGGTSSASSVTRGTKGELAAVAAGIGMDGEAAGVGEGAAPTAAESGLGAGFAYAYTDGANAYGLGPPASFRSASLMPAWSVRRPVPPPPPRPP